jgi:putative glutamine amidotransferase
LPVIEPDDVDAVLARVDGLLMTGGGDVAPASYGAQADPRTNRVDATRDAHDIALCRHAIERDLPMLAICRGSQILNVAVGGTLVQHIDDHFDMDRYNETVHKVDVDPSSALARWTDDGALGVNTLHHQAVDVVGAQAKVVAHAEDGTIEGIEISERIVGVQWHPELLRHRPEHLALFQHLVSLAGG